MEGQARAGATALSSLTLTSSERSFTLDFAAPDFVAPQRLTYPHRLEGLDDEWTVAGPSQHSLTVSRMPPKEFLVVVRFVDRAEAGELAEKLRAAIAGHAFVLPDGTVLERTCSIGYASWPTRDGASWEHVIDRADAALYAAKRGGRNACVGAETLVA